jgi:hypothetical protein
MVVGLILGVHFFLLLCVYKLVEGIFDHGQIMEANAVNSCAICNVGPGLKYASDVNGVR